MSKERKVGQPLKWNNPKELQEKILEYFDWAKENDMNITITGLSWYLGCSKQTLQNYENCEDNDWLKRCSDEEKKQYVDLLKDVKRYVEMNYEERLYNRQKVTGGIFALKNLFGWVDRQEVVNKEDNNINITLEDTEE